MKKTRIEQIISEIYVRFGGKENWRSIKLLKQATDTTYQTNSGMFTPRISEGTSYNINGEICQINTLNGDISWGIADIKRAPMSWVVEKDESNPLWGLFVEEYNKTHSIDSMRYFGNHGKSLILTSRDDWQYLTLEQWKLLIYDCPEINNICLFSTIDENVKIISRLVNVTNIDGEIKYIDTTNNIWDYCELLDKELNNLLNNKL